MMGEKEAGGGANEQVMAAVAPAGRRRQIQSLEHNAQNLELLIYESIAALILRQQTS